MAANIQHPYCVLLAMIRTFSQVCIIIIVSVYYHLPLLFIYYVYSVRAFSLVHLCKFAGVLHPTGQLAYATFVVSADGGLWAAVVYAAVGEGWGGVWRMLVVFFNSRVYRRACGHHVDAHVTWLVSFPVGVA